MVKSGTKQDAKAFTATVHSYSPFSMALSQFCSFFCESVFFIISPQFPTVLERQPSREPKTLEPTKRYFKEVLESPKNLQSLANNIFVHTKPSYNHG
jgi:hypothetical protein